MLNLGLGSGPRSSGTLLPIKTSQGQCTGSLGLCNDDDDDDGGCCSTITPYLDVKLESFHLSMLWAEKVFSCALTKQFLQGIVF